MSIRQIIDNCEDVITALIDSEIANKHVLSVRDQEKFKALSYDILADVQTIKEKIYKQQYTNLTFFLYLCKIM